MPAPHLRRVFPAVLLCVGFGSAFASSPARIEALLKQGDPAALVQAQAFVERNDADARAWVLLARAQLQQGKAADAIDSAEEAVERAPDDAQAHLWLGNSLGVRIGQVNMLRKMTLAPSLRDAFETAVRLDPTLFDARNALISFYLQAPAAIGGGADKAKAQVAEIAKRNAARGHLAQLSIDGFNKDEAAAKRSLDAALAAVQPDDRDVRLSVGMALQGYERWDDARAHFQRWAAEQPAQAAPRYQIGRIAAVTGQHLDEGAGALREYLSGNPQRHDSDPKDTHAWWRLGQIEAKRGDVEAARGAFQAALRLDPANEEAKQALAAL